MSHAPPPLRNGDIRARLAEVARQEQFLEVVPADEALRRWRSAAPHRPLPEDGHHPSEPIDAGTQSLPGRSGVEERDGDHGRPEGRIARGGAPGGGIPSGQLPTSCFGHGDSLPGAPRGAQASSAASTSSLTSTLVNTAWTSSLSSSASTRRKTLRAVSSSAGTETLGTKVASAES